MYELRKGKSHKKLDRSSKSEKKILKTKMSKPQFPDDAEMSSPSPPPEGIPMLEAEVASAAKRMRAAVTRASEAVEVRLGVSRI